MSTYEYAISGTHKPLLKVEHYFPIYDTHLQRFKGKAPQMLEIGVYNGGSLEMWKDVLGHNSSIVGIDISPTVLDLKFSPGIQVALCNQEDKPALHALSTKFGGFDIILDDGGHRMKPPD